MAGDEKTPSEQRFERYLEEHGYRFEHHPELGIAKKPDYLVGRDAIEIVCEVKEFKTWAITEHVVKMGGAAFVPHKLDFGPVRRKIRAAARQLKPLVGRGLPLVVILSDPHHADVDMDPEDIVHAMYGNPAITFAWGPEGPVGEGTYFANRDGALTQDHRYISAVGTLHEMPIGTSRFVNVFHTVSAMQGAAVVLPESVFNGPDDHAWAATGQGAYSQVR